MKTTRSLFLLLILLTAACLRPATDVRPAAPAVADVEVPRDIHSYARPNEIRVRHLSLDLGVDFDTKRFDGTATLDLTRRGNATQLWLDTRDLEIRSVKLGDGSNATFRLGELEKEVFGRALVIDVGPTADRVVITYRTSPEAGAVQWLTPAQTAGKKRPFLFTQSQAILARSWVPIQDTPSVRFTYDATVRVPNDLLAVMSAENPQSKNATGTYRFNMRQPIPSYLLALAVGDLEFRPLGPRSGVYAEPGMIDKAAWELADTEKFIAAAERLYGPYRFDRYDMLVLPPSFPFGGMENPRLTFLTPTMLAGDRSLVSLIAHELAHSWSGNLVTNATWNDFWLNEGFTTYIEYRLMEELYGRDYSEMLASLARQSLMTTLEDLGSDSRATHLYMDLSGKDPDEASSDIAYEKGALFLRHIEETVGRAKFDAFLKKYFSTFAFVPMDTKRFVEFLRSELIRGDAELEEKIALDRWIYGPGLPADAPVPTSTRFARVDAQLQSFAKGTPASSLQTKEWSTHEWLHFLRNLPKPLSLDRMRELDAAFKFTGSGNAEILTEWFRRSIENRYETAYPALERFLMTVGRRKFLDPLYRELVKTPEGRQFATRVYTNARAGYHPVTQGTVDTILEFAVK